MNNPAAMVHLPILIGGGSSHTGPVINDAMLAFQASRDWPQLFDAGSEQGRNLTALVGCEVLGQFPTGEACDAFHAEFRTSGSGQGRVDVINGVIDFSAAESTFTPDQLAAYDDLQQIPHLATSACIAFNIPELQDSTGRTPKGNTIILDKTTLPLIFAGNITMWNDPMILTLQLPNVASLLPNRSIEVIVRSDSSGTTNILTRTLSLWSPAWAAEVGYSDFPAWPARLKKSSANLVTGVIAAVMTKPYGLTYSPLFEGTKFGVALANIINSAGNVIVPSTDSVSIALLERGGQLDAHMNANLQDASSPKAYPLAGYSYICLRMNFSPGQDCVKRALLVSFLHFYYTATDVISAIKIKHGMVHPPQLIIDQILPIISSIQCEGHPALAYASPKQPVFTNVPTMQSFSQLSTSIYLAIDASLSPTNADVTQLDDAVAAVKQGQTSLSLISMSSFADGTTDAISLSLPSNMALLPVGVGALTPLVNPLVSVHGAIIPIVLSLEVLALIYIGSITQWNDPRIVALNQATWSTTAAAPNQAIQLVLFQGPSESTRVIRSVLSAANEDFRSACGLGNTWSQPGVDNRCMPATPYWVLEENRVYPAVQAVPYSMGFVLQGDILENVNQIVLATATTGSINAALSTNTNATVLMPSVTTIQNCFPAPPPIETWLTDAVASPLTHLADDTSSYQSHAAAWSTTFGIGINPSNLPTNCWPFTITHGVVVPLDFSQMSSDAIAKTTSRAVISSLSNADSESLREKSAAASCTFGAFTARSLLWLLTSTVAAQMQQSLSMAALPTYIRHKVTEAIQHSTCTGSDGESKTWLLDAFPELFTFSFASQLSQALCALGLAFCAVLAFAIGMMRDRPVIRALSVPFSSYLLLGACASFISLPLITVATDVNTHQCMSAAWLIVLGFGTMYGTLLFKTWRIFQIFMKAKFKMTKLTNRRLSMYLLYLVIVFAIPLIVWQIQSPMDRVLVMDHSNTNSDGSVLLHYQCGSKNTATYIDVLLVMMAALLLASSIVAILVRNVASSFNESKLLGFSIYICTILFLVVGLGMNLLYKSNSRDGYTLLLIGGLWLNNFATLSLILGYKVYLGYTHPPGKSSTDKYADPLTTGSSGSPKNTPASPVKFGVNAPGGLSPRCGSCGSGGISPSSVGTAAVSSTNRLEQPQPTHSRVPSSERLSGVTLRRTSSLVVNNKTKFPAVVLGRSPSGERDAPLSPLASLSPLSARNISFSSVKVALPPFEIATPRQQQALPRSIDHSLETVDSASPLDNDNDEPPFQIQLTPMLEHGAVDHGTGSFTIHPQTQDPQMTPSETLVEPQSTPTRCSSGSDLRAKGLRIHWLNSMQQQQIAKMFDIETNVIIHPDLDGEDNKEADNARDNI